MTSLDRNLRKQLENKVKDARRVAEAGARQAIEQLAVHHHEPWAPLSPAQRQLRNRLRAHGRQLGDRLDERKGAQVIDRLIAECAYEHWHRLLFARFLAENDLLVEPDSSMPLSLEECRELARDRGVDWLVLAGEFAQRMLPQIFRTGDPVLEVTLPPEKRQELEALLEALPREVFAADDSLGWVYQYWQAEQRDRVNKSGAKIGAEEVSAVTQLFTEDYMVLFLLHNTIGAWWASKHLAAHSELARSAQGEEELRKACSLPDVAWEYLRFVKDANGCWRAAAGAFDTWPIEAKALKVLDPCMGSGHFLVFALPILVALRMREENIVRDEAVLAVLRDNLFGLEIDPRCTQLAAFNLALTAWRLVGHRPMPALNLACAGLGINAKEGEWTRLAGSDIRAQGAMKGLYDLLSQAPLLGSLIDPRRIGGELFVSEFAHVRSLLQQAISSESSDEARDELAVTAQGIAQAVHVLLGRFTLVVTNVPYLGRTKQHSALREYCDKSYSDGKADLSTCFVLRCLSFCADGGTSAVVTPQNWLFQTAYKELRRSLLRGRRWRFAAKLGPAAFQNMNFWAATTALVVLDSSHPTPDVTIAGLDVSGPRDPNEKAKLLPSCEMAVSLQSEQLKNPEARIVLGGTEAVAALSQKADCYQGIKTGDDERYRRFFWELPRVTPRWRFFQSTVESTCFYGGLERIIDWTDEGAALARRQGMGAWSRRGVMVSQMNTLPVALYVGDVFDSNASPVVPREEEDLLAIWAFCASPSYRESVRTLDQAVKPSNSSLIQVPFDVDFWRDAAESELPHGLPEPSSDDPTQWLFAGRPANRADALHVTVARLVGYEWPRQESDNLRTHVDGDGIVCLAPLRGEASASDRVRAMLAEALPDWSGATQSALLARANFDGRSLDDWLRDGFFDQHCVLFQQRPFIWHVWDGLKNGFGAFVNYHRLAAPGGEGRRTLEKLIYTYLGDWIDRQRADQTAGVEGADGRVAAAEHLKRELEKILEGEAPYDIFVRWKPIQQQPVGWDPDVDDGVRVNIRPFITAKTLSVRSRSACILRAAPKIKWDKDRGKESSCPKGEYPWFWSWDEQTADFLGGSEFDGNRWNDLHYSRETKTAARARAKRGGKS